MNAHQEAPVKGKGLVATRSELRGTRILFESPCVRVHVVLDSKTLLVNIRRQLDMFTPDYECCLAVA